MTMCVIDMDKVEYAQLNSETSYSMWINGFEHKINWANKADCDKNWAFVCKVLDALNEKKNAEAVAPGVTAQDNVVLAQDVKVNEAERGIAFKLYEEEDESRRNRLLDGLVKNKHIANRDRVDNAYYNGFVEGVCSYMRYTSAQGTAAQDKKPEGAEDPTKTSKREEKADAEEVKAKMIAKLREYLSMEPNGVTDAFPMFEKELVEYLEEEL